MDAGRGRSPHSARHRHERQDIYTSISDSLQASAERALLSGLEKLEARSGRRKSGSPQPLQAAILALEPSTGHIRAMVGGRDYAASQFNRAWQALRQPGSAFKPILFAAAIERGYSSADLLGDTPLSIRIDGTRTWTPENFTRTYQGNVTLRKALAQSLNVPTVRLLSKIGVNETIRCARGSASRAPCRPCSPSPSEAPI